MHQSTWSVVVSKCGSIKSLKWTSKVKSYFLAIQNIVVIKSLGIHITINTNDKKSAKNIDFIMFNAENRLAKSMTKQSHGPWPCIVPWLCIVGVMALYKRYKTYIYIYI